MGKITVTGASDDLIEVDGVIREEFGVCDDDRHYLAVSDGTVLSIVYDHDGIWRVNRVYGVVRLTARLTVMWKMTRMTQ